MRHAPGFTLLEIVIVLGIIAVLAGAMAPYAVKQIEGSRLDATEKEMESIQQAIVEYYKDCGRLPSDQAGLLALVQNADAVPGWRGPYVQGSGALATAIQTDAWGSPYVYAERPAVQQIGAAVGFLLISPGLDRVLQSGQAQARWSVDPDRDMVLLGTTSGADGPFRKTTDDRMDALTDGLAQYYLDVGAFPSGQDSVALSALLSSSTSGWSGPYVAGTPSDIARDAWGNRLRLRACSSVDGEAVGGWLLLSDGPGLPAASVNNGDWLTGANDVYRAIPEGSLKASLNRRRMAEAARRVKLLTGEIYATNLAASPESSTLAQNDPWDGAYQYKKLSAYSGILYSYGPDGKDDSGADDDIYEALSWSP
ncbi:MAG: type II secretion system protein GspG [Candidatus Eisenbacteria bacterium]